MVLPLVVFLVFLGLLMGGLWAPFSIAAAALLYIYLEGGVFGLRAIGLASWGGLYSFTLTAVPLFLLMAEVLLQSGVANRVYRGLSRIVRRLPGGLLQTNIVGCAVFSAISGSSVATAAGIGTVAMPQLLQRGYSRKLSAGSLAGGGTLGILIPPSIAMIIYGTFTETSVSQLFMAGIIPGLMTVALFMLLIGVLALIKPSIAPRETATEEPPVNWTETAADLLPFSLVILVTLGSIYFGIATPTEAAAVGSVISIAVGVIWGNLSWSVFLTALRNTTRTSASLLFIVLAAFLFSYAIGIDGFGRDLSAWLLEQELSKPMLLLAIILLYLILGCVVESIGIMVITLPVLYPILLAYDIDLIWFGVVLVLLIELGQLTPPLGINLFVIQSIWEGKLEEVVQGTIPFFLIIFAMVFVLWTVPELATWLPSLMVN
ncbi:MAG: TRAP transporter large permease [Pseudomonadota bacterium]